MSFMWERDFLRGEEEILALCGDASLLFVSDLWTVRRSSDLCRRGLEIFSLPETCPEVMTRLLDVSLLGVRSVFSPATVTVDSFFWDARRLGCDVSPSTICSTSTAVSFVSGEISSWLDNLIDAMPI